MKRLIIGRHATTENTSASGKDFDRKLTPFGKEQAETMAVKMQEWLNEDYFVHCSSAQRTTTTAHIYSKTWTFDKSEIRFDKTIYNADYLSLLSIINTLSESKNTCVIIGHNPGVSDLVYYLTGKYLQLRPSDSAVVDFDFSEWNLISMHTGVLQSFLEHKKSPD